MNVGEFANDKPQHHVLEQCRPRSHTQCSSVRAAKLPRYLVYAVGLREDGWLKDWRSSYTDYNQGKGTARAS